MNHRRWTETVLCPPPRIRKESFMTDVIVLIILAVLVGGAVSYIVKAKKSGVKCIGCPAGGNCPGSAKIPKKKLEGRVVGRKAMKIAGMNCAHCAMDAANALNRIEGVQAEVNLSKGSAKIFYDREVDDDILKKAVEDAGFKVLSIMQVPGRVLTGKRQILEGETPNPAEEIRGCKFCSRCPRCTPLCREEEPQYREAEKGHYV